MTRGKDEQPLHYGGPRMAEAVREAYSQGQTDYSLEPIVMADADGRPVGRIRDGDAVVFCCRRGEREIQLTEAFVESSWDRFPRRRLERLTFVPLTLYHDKFRDLPVAFAPSPIDNTLGEVVSRSGLAQARVAESEKFSHVTFFFNGGRQQSFAGETDVRVPSPHGTPFEEVPELSLPEVVPAVLHAVREGSHLIVANFANGDVIGHTSSVEAKLRCVDAVDAALGEVVDAAVPAGYAVMVTADHGNLEEMSRPDGSAHVSHTANPVPFLYVEAGGTAGGNVQDGRLADVAPTVLKVLGIEPPVEMEGSSLLSQDTRPRARRVLLLILDGWGLGREDGTNPIFLAPARRWRSLLHTHPSSRLQAAGEAVGLQPGKAGNSEAGHMNLGAGRVVLQDDVRLDLAMRDGSFSSNPTLLRTLEQVQRSGPSLHLIGLLSDKSSHGSIDYPLAVLRMAKAHGLRHAFLHLIFDGRSTQPGSAPKLLEKLEGELQEIGIGQLASGVGRGLALDRNGDYTKTQRAYEAMVDGVGRRIG